MRRRRGQRRGTVHGQYIRTLRCKMPPRTPELILEDLATNGGSSGQKCSNPQITAHPKLNIDMGGGRGDQHSLHASIGFEYIVHVLSVAMVCFVFPLTSTPLTTSAGRGSHKPCKSTSGPQWPHNGLTMATQWPLVISQVAPTISVLQKII